MSDDLITSLRAFEAAHKQLRAALDAATSKRDEALAEVERQIRHGDLLYDQIERRTRERDEARYFLSIFLHAHANGNAVPPHIEERARKALEAKP